MTFKTFFQLTWLISLILVLPCYGQIAIEADPVRVSRQWLKDEGEPKLFQEQWKYEVKLKNETPADTGQLVLQYRYSWYPSLDRNHKPDLPIRHDKGELKVKSLHKGEERALKILIGQLIVAERTRASRHILQGIRVRVWQRGKLVGEYTEKGSKAAKIDWPMSPPAVPEGAEAGVGPWLLLTAGEQNFAGLRLGDAAGRVAKLLKHQDCGKVTAKPMPRFGYPLTLTVEKFPRCFFYFTADKKLAAIQVADPKRVKLPGKLLLSRSTLADFKKVFGDAVKSSLPGSGRNQLYDFQLEDSLMTADIGESGKAVCLILRRKN